MVVCNQETQDIDYLLQCCQTPDGVSLKRGVQNVAQELIEPLVQSMAAVVHGIREGKRYFREVSYIILECKQIDLQK